MSTSIFTLAKFKMNIPWTNGSLVLVFQCNYLELEPLPQSPVSKVPPTQQDPAFFDNVQNDVSRILRQEKMQEEYKKVV